MLNAFQDLGYDVTVVDGYSRERREKIAQLKNALQRGERFDFRYAENAPSPYALADPDHLPRHPLIDCSFFQLMKKHLIPVGLFYRDIYWQFSAFREEHPLLIRLFSYPFYYFDLNLIKRCKINTLFLPSLEMGEYFPAIFKSPQQKALPPGASVIEASFPNKPIRHNAIYVGGLMPPLYDLRPTFELMQQLPRWRLTIICRESEWRQSKDIYKWNEAANISVKHASGERIQELLLESDIFLLLRNPDPYLSFAMPVKIFEAIGCGLPIVTNSWDAVGNLVESEGVGWVEPNLDCCVTLLREMHEDTISAKRRQVELSRQNHTWCKRAETVVQTLKSKDQTGPNWR
jgi:glycosyltransferase involved in cell wall biosynthesis